MPRKRVQNAVVTAVFAFLCLLAGAAVTSAAPSLNLSIDLGPGTGPRDAAVLDAHAVQRVYNTNFGTSTVIVINLGVPATSSIALNSGAASPYGIAVFNDAVAPKVYVTNKTHSTVSVIDASGGMDVELTGAGYPIGVGANPMGIAVMPFGSPSHKVYVANNTNNTVSVINGDTHAVTQLIGGFNAPYGVAVNSVTGKVYVANSGSNTISIVNPATDAITGSILVGAGPRGIAVDEANNRIFVACAGAQRVYMIDGTTDTVVSQAALSASPEDVAVVPGIGLVYVTVPGLNHVRVFKTQTGMPEVSGSPLSIGQNPQGIVAAAASIAADPWILFAAASTGNSLEVIQETDSYPPVFGGLATAADAGEPLSGLGPSMHLSWGEATDHSLPVFYHVFVATTSGGQDFNSPLFSTDQFGSHTFSGAGLHYAQDYYIIVRASDSSALGNMDANTVEHHLKLTDGAAPSGGLLTGATDTGIGGEVALEWSLATDDTPPITYNIYTGLATDAMSLATSVTGVTPLTLSGLPNDVKRYFLVRARDAAGLASTNTVFGEATPTDITPPVFGGLVSAVDAGSGRTVSLSWNAGSDESGSVTYAIYMEAGASVSFSTAVYSTTATSYDVSGLTNGTQYTFGVRAFDASGNYDSNTIAFSATPTDVLDPAFSGVSSCADLGADGQVKLFWSAASDNTTPVYYNVYQATASGSQNFASWDYRFSATAAVVLSGLTNGTTYYYVVRAEDSASPPNEDTNTAQCAVKPTDGAAPVFSGLASATATGNTGEILLSWTAATDVSSPIYYNIYAATSSGGQNFSSWTYQAVATTTYTATGLTDGQMYYFVVRAQDTGGLQETNTVQKSARPNDGTPPVFGGVTGLTDAMTSGALIASWAAAADPATPISYEVFRSTTSGGQNFTSPATTTTATSALLTGMANNVPYYIVVRARDAGGVSDTNVVELSATPTDQTAPTFAGITSATDKQLGGVIELNWSPASDPSAPLVYSIYMRIPPAAFDWGAPMATTQYRPYQVTGLTNGATYSFSIGVSDSASPTANMATNAVELSAAPSDLTAPTFAGIKTLADARTSGAGVLTWTAATDNSGIDHYDIYYATSPTGFWSKPPAATAAGTATGTTITGLSNGNLYYVGVRAVDASAAANSDTNTARLTFVPSDTQAPAFSGLASATDTTQGGQVVLSWSAASDPSAPITYNIYYAQNATPGFVTVSTTTTATGATITGLTNNTPYYFVVRAKDSYGNTSTHSTPIVVTPTDVVQPSFAGLSAASDTTAGGEIHLTWAAASDNSPPITYSIYQATTSGAQSFASPSYTTTNTSYTVSGLNNGTAYYFVVRAADASAGGNQETNTVERSAIPSDTTAPAFAGLASAQDTGRGNTVALAWSTATDNSPPVTYNIYQASYSGLQNFSSPTYTTQNTSYTVTGLTNGARYYFVVRARDSAVAPNEDTNTLEREARPFDTLAPQAPSAVSALAGDITGEPGDEYVTISWTPPSANADGSALTDLAGFNVYRSVVPGQPPSTPQNDLDSVDNDGDGLIDGNDIKGDLIPATATQYVDNTSITSGTTYYYTVTAQDQAGNESPLSDLVSAIPRNADDATPMPPDNVIAAPGDSRVILSWSAPLVNTDESVLTDLQGYNVYRSVTTGGNYSLINSSIVTQTTYTDSTVTNGTTYYYVVTALDTAVPPNESANSAESAVTPNDSGSLPPAPPTALAVVSLDSGASLSWSAPTTNSDGSPLQDLAGYNIFRSTDSASGFAKINAATVTIRTYIDSGLTNGVTYYYFVTAIDTDGLESAPSSTGIAVYGSRGVQGRVLAYDTSSGPTVNGYPKTPVSGMSVQLLNASSAVVSSGITDGSGYFKLVYENAQSGELFSVRLVIPDTAPYAYDDEFVENGHGYFRVKTGVSIGTGFMSITVPALGAGPTAGDANCDGLIDIKDFLIMRGSYGLSSGQTGYNSNIDINGDTVVDITDFVLLKATFGRSLMTPPTGLCQN